MAAWRFDQMIRPILLAMACLLFLLAACGFSHQRVNIESLGLAFFALAFLLG